MPVSRQLIRLSVLDCDPSVEVDDLVAWGPGGILIPARADSISTMPAVGCVVQKTAPNKCRIDQIYFLSGLTGIENRKPFFVSPDVGGAVTDDVPGSNQIIQHVATGVGTDRLMVHVSVSDFVIRR